MVIADGPFAETKEQIAGVLIVGCVDRSEAIKVAAQVPAAHYGTIEVKVRRTGERGTALAAAGLAIATLALLLTMLLVL